jgi:hypothetical protein
MSSTKKKRKVIHSEGREIVGSVIEKCDEESRNNCLKYRLNQATRRAAHYANVSETTIKQIRKEHKQRQESDRNKKLSTPGKKRRTRPQHTTVFLDEFDRCVIRRTIHDFYLRERKVSTLLKLLPVIKNNTSFPVLRFPPHMCDLSTMELAWAKVKRLVRLNNVTGDLSLQSLMDLTKSAIASVTKEDLAGYSKHVQMLEQQYWEENGQLPDVIDNIISLGATEQQ